MAKPLLHKVCGTSHWSTERCPLNEKTLGAGLKQLRETPGAIIKPTAVHLPVPSVRQAREAEPLRPKPKARVVSAGKAAPSRAVRERPLSPVAIVAPSQSSPSKDGVALNLIAHPKGKDIGRGRAVIHKAALETLEIDIPVPETVEAWRAVACDFARRALAAEKELASRRKKASDRVKKFRKKAKRAKT